VRRTSDSGERSSVAVIGLERLGAQIEGRRGAACAMWRGGGGGAFYRAGRRWRGGGATSFLWGSDGGRAALRYGSPRAEEGTASGGAQHGNAGQVGGGGSGVR
jgi:hypothetical protein